MQENNRQNGSVTIEYWSQNNKWNNKQNNQYSPQKSNQQINQVNVEVVEETRAETNEGSNDKITHAVNSIPVNGKTVSSYLQCRIEDESVQLL